MRRESKKNSLTEDDKKEIFRLRVEERLSYVKIASIFNVDHTTIIYHLKKMKAPTIKTKNSIQEYIEKIEKKQTKKQKEIYLKYPLPKINRGKTYKGYLKQLEVRNRKGFLTLIKSKMKK